MKFFNKLRLNLCSLLLLIIASNVFAIDLQQALTLSPPTPPVNQIPVATPPAAIAPTTIISNPQLFDYSVNIKSNVFGANLFTGAFAREGATQFNPDYVIATGDQIQVRFWGAFEYDALLTVDPQGNVFVPHIGPIKILGIRNKELQSLFSVAVRKVFLANVSSYASLAAAQPVRVFVSGFVNRPGLYSGTSMDSLLHYLDQSGGIDAERGSFLNVQVKRGSYVRATVNLYDFLLNGQIPLIQLGNGDVIFVSPKQKSVIVSGLVANAKVFEFNHNRNTVADLIEVSKPSSKTTHVRIVRNTGVIKNIEYFPLYEAANIILESGDELEFTADKKPGTITVRVEGEHKSAQEYVLPHGALLGDLITQIEYSVNSDFKNLQLFRHSVRERQKELLLTSLERLEASVLTARSGTTDEAQLRASEAELIMQWVTRAKDIEPSGQVVISQATALNELLLENGDIIKIPALNNLVLVSGEVMFPNTIAIEPNKTFEYYIENAGGYSQNADSNRVIIAHVDGSFEDIAEKNSMFSEEIIIRPGDEILVLPKVDLKSRQFAKEIMTMIYQLALGARTILAF